MSWSVESCYEETAQRLETSLCSAAIGEGKTHQGGTLRSSKRSLCGKGQVSGRSWRTHLQTELWGECASHKICRGSDHQVAWYQEFSTLERSFEASQEEGARFLLDHHLTNSYIAYVYCSRAVNQNIWEHHGSRKVCYAHTDKAYP